MHIKPGFLPSFISNITIDNTAYTIHTEEVSKKSTRVISRVFLDGEIIMSEEADYSVLAGKNDFPRRLEGLMKRLHKKVIDKFTKECIKKQKKKSEYFDEVRDLLETGRNVGAIKVLKKGLERFPTDPFLLSYYGCLYSIVRKKPKEGIRMCRAAINKLDYTVPFEKEVYYPLFYLNLGRAYLAGGKKREALRAFNVGLKADPTDRDIIGELQSLGSRRKLPLPFLGRNNPINKYIGLLIGKAKMKK